MMATRGEMRLPGSLTEYLLKLESAFVVLPITASVAVRSMQFSSSFPKDPADRIIAATAAVHGLQLVTNDMNFACPAK